MRMLNPSRDAVRFIEDLPLKHFRQIWLKILKLLHDPFPADASALKGYDYHRVDIGEYRIVYTATHTQLNLILIGKRNDGEVYKQLSRKHTVTA